MTLGEFVELLVQKDTNHEIWIEDWQNHLAEGDWESYKYSKLDKKLLLRFSRSITQLIKDRISSIWGEDLYALTIQDGHRFLMGIHALAQAQGIEVSLEEINVPLTMAEAMV